MKWRDTKFSFKHAGDLGDIIYSLPTIRELGGGILYLNQWPERTRVLMDEAQRDFIAPLLSAQSYISAVEMYRGQSVLFDLNLFRKVWAEKPEFGVSLAAWHCRTFDVPEEVVNKLWLDVGPMEVAPVVIHRSARYHNAECVHVWRRVVEKYRDVIFVGLRQEFDQFKGQFGCGDGVRYYPVSDALEMARVIAGAKLFIGNQSFPNALAEGLKKPKITETFMVDPNCCFERLDAQNVFTRNVYLPDL